MGRRGDGARGRQFLLGPTRAPSMTGWRSNPVGDGLLESGPDLAVVQIEGPGSELTLLGYILDPTNAGRGDVDIARELARIPNLDDLPDATASLSGRWTIIARRGAAGIVFSDPAGLRQVHYASDGNGATWCATQARQLADALGLAPDPDATAFVSSPYFRAYPEPFLPADTTPYRGARRLLPDHYLDLETGLPVRFWPTHPLVADPSADPVGTIAELLRGTLRAAHERGPLALGLSAGWDSRTLLAASRDIAEDVLYFTIDNDAGGGNAADVRVASRLAARLGLNHIVIPGREVEPRFLESFAESVDTPHRYCAGHVLGLSRHLPVDRLAVTGNCSEFGRCYMRGLHPEVRATADSLATFFNMAGSEWATAAFARWIDDARPSAERCGIDVIDLLELEVLCGAWLAHGQGEWDAATDTLSPYDCRAVMETFLATDPSARMPPVNAMHRELMRRLWPEVLEEPINPLSLAQSVSANARHVASSALHRTGMYGLAKACYVAARSRMSH